MINKEEKDIYIYIYLPIKTDLRIATDYFEKYIPDKRSIDDPDDPRCRIEIVCARVQLYPSVPTRISG